MKLSRVPVNMYKKFFLVLVFTFLGFFAIEFIFCLVGNPIGEITINDRVFKLGTLMENAVFSALMSFFVSGIVNFFLTVRILKELFGVANWPAAVVVIMTMFFPLELLLAMLFLVPNIIVFGLKGRKKNRVYQVDFR